MIMNLLRFLFLGFIQGFTEPIPVSSSGHLLIFQKILFKSDLNIDYEILATITNFGSFLAILILYRKEVINLFKSFFGYLTTKKEEYKKDFKYCWMIVLATIPAGIMGIGISKLNLFDKLESNIKFVGLTLLITSLFLFLIKDLKGKKDKYDITYKDALIVGMFQVLALIPGISRSGATIVGGMTRRFKRTTAFDFSFILYIPISIGTTLLGLKDLISSNLTLEMWFFYGLATIVAMVFTLLATKWFRKVVKDGKLIYFVIYCLLAGLSVIIFLK